MVTASALPSTRPSRRERAAAENRFEPWRDWAILALVNHGLLLAVALTRPSLPWLLLATLPMSVGLATGTLTILHDAGHRRFSRRAWPNVIAVQTGVPAGLWAMHWTLKHKVHHKVTQVYPLDDATRSSGMVRLHPSAPRRPVHRYQHIYAWFLYGLAWAGELRSQVTFLRTGKLSGIESPGPWRRTGSFAVEKALTFLLLTPYAILLGVPRLLLFMLVSMTVASLLAAVVLVVGHINMGLIPTAEAPTGQQWASHLVRTTASFNLRNPVVRWFTGGMTHHLAHHLRPVAPRSELPEIERTHVAKEVARAGLPEVVYPTLTTAVIGHARRLKALGRYDELVDDEPLPGTHGQPGRSLLLTQRRRIHQRDPVATRTGEPATG